MKQKILLRGCDIGDIVFLTDRSLRRYVVTLPLFFSGEDYRHLIPVKGPGLPLMYDLDTFVYKLKS